MKRIFPGLAVIAIIVLVSAGATQEAAVVQPTAVIQPQYPHQQYEPDPDDDFGYTIIGDGDAIEISEYKGTKTDVRIPGILHNLPVTVIGDGVFRSKQLSSVAIPNTVTYIGKRAFEDNPITYIAIPNSVIEISSSAFRDNHLTSITIGTNVEISDVIYDCRSIDYEDVFDNGFADFYVTNGKKAGTCILSNGQWRANNG